MHSEPLTKQVEYIWECIYASPQHENSLDNQLFLHKTLNENSRGTLASYSQILTKESGSGSCAVNLSKNTASSCKVVSSPDTKFFARALRPCQKIGSGHLHW